MEITVLLQRIQSGDRSGLDAVMPLIYAELKKLALSHVRREGPQRPMEATTLVHEAYLRLVHAKHPEYQCRAHFFWIASRLMRQILVDAARARKAGKRGGVLPVQLSDAVDAGYEPDGIVLAVDGALERLAEVCETKAALMEMRYFGGMTAEECAEAKGMSVHVVRKQIRLAKAWMRRELTHQQDSSLQPAAD